ncbi:MAG: DUF481 domain-containing protein [Gammaproteobacteria bacterium]|jgi:putative salt-induced outer membrane protein|nr:hypothetical protein [Chromatiales bacterium]MDP7154163.1 DUF481 domain-containing protein [Gammaproteobacteria bacterium]MDP7296112.1 DUF481 domain-containing protein [Gammaproteobacteria bacterium]MDP7419060.1 DUF481 domain-containing protein [Gammaproteobacteria bacterium]MDP7660741.1 DUF481 domain-containing protein [Gammaproteobacteria bacterium]
MFYLQLRVILVAVTIGIPMQVWANEDPRDPWSGSVALGYLSVNGNTESTSFTGKAELGWDQQRWHHALLVRALGKSEDKNTTAESYKATYEGKFDLSARSYLFGMVDYNKDRFSGYDQQIYETAGIGRRFINIDRHELNGELSAGASQSVVIEALPAPPAAVGTIGRNRVNEAVLRIAGNYKWVVSENSTFTQKVSVSSGSNNTYTESVTELSVGIIAALSMVLAYTVKHNSDVADGKDKTDTFTSIALEYRF